MKVPPHLRKGRGHLSKPKLDLCGRLVRSRVERDPALCESLNGDVGSLDPNFGKQILCLVLSLFILEEVICVLFPFELCSSIYLLMSLCLQVNR